MFDVSQSPIKFNKHLCAASNPPFGTKITIKDPEVLKQFDLAELSSSTKDSNWEVKKSRLYTRAPDILFLEQNVRLLAPGKGRLAIVLPYQILSGPQTLYIRTWLLRHTQLLAVIDLPGETFQPHTGTKTALVVVRRRKKPLVSLDEMGDDPIFMSVPRWIGHDRRGNPVYKRTSDGKLTDHTLTDFGEVEDAWEAFTTGQEFRHIHDMSFSISPNDLTKDSLLRINALFYKPTEDKQINAGSKTALRAWRKIKLQDVTRKNFIPEDSSVIMWTIFRGQYLFLAAAISLK